MGMLSASKVTVQMLPTYPVYKRRKSLILLDPGTKKSATPADACLPRCLSELRRPGTQLTTPRRRHMHVNRRQKRELGPNAPLPYHSPQVALSIGFLYLDN